MALFQRRPATYNQNLSYTIAYSGATMLIVGLGNPGKKYDGTRHNVGFEILDKFLEVNEFEPFKENKKFKGLIAERVVGNCRVILFKPSTYMNLSGEATRLVADYYKIDPNNLIAVYDELSLDFGVIRSRIGGQSAGHNGVKSLIQHLSTANFGRLRIGINNELAKTQDSSDFVLKRFTKEEQSKIPSLVNESCNMLTEFIFSGKVSEETRTIDVG
jgi:PTH1 family peptidyl-tRNA hydrolase